MDFLQSFEPLYAVSGFLVGGLVGMTGVGGGALMTPILVLLFGVHPATAVGTDLLYASATKTGGAIVHGWRGTIDWKVVGLLAAGSVPMTALTILTLYELDIGSHATQAIITNVLGVALFSLRLRSIFACRCFDITPPMLANSIPDGLAVLLFSPAPFWAFW